MHHHHKKGNSLLANDGDASIADFNSDDCNTVSDRGLLDSVQQLKGEGGGVNVPMNSLPKLSRHRKSDLLANELEGNP